MQYPTEKQLRYRADLYHKAIALGHDATELRATMGEHPNQSRGQVSGHIKFLRGLIYNHDAKVRS